MRATIYARISNDREGAGLGVARQEEDCRALADRRGLTVTDVLVDNDLSAYSGKPRPGYLQLIERLKANDIDVVLAWHPDRLHRSPRELEDFIDLLDAAGATVETVSAGQVDLSSPSGRMTARIVGAVARHESEHKSERQRRANLQAAREGRPCHGGTRPFGYEPDLVTIRPDEAAHIRAAVDHMLAGGTLKAILRQWNTNGVRPVQADRWSMVTVKRLLTRPRLAGLREHRGVVVGPAAWPAIITVEEHERLKAAVAARSITRGPNRRYLLTGGLGTCGLCGTQVYARPRGDGRRCYVCASDHGGCGKIRCLAEPLEAYVVSSLLAATRAGRFTPPEGTPDGRATVLAEIADLGARRDQLATDHYVTGDLQDPRQFRAASEALEGRLIDARGRLAALDDAQAAADARQAATTLHDRWDAMTVDEQRYILQTLIETVELGAAMKGRNYFDPARVEVRWTE